MRIVHQINNKNYALLISIGGKMSELVINNNIVNDLLIKQFTNYVFMMIVTDIKGNIIYANKNTANLIILILKV